MSPSGPKKHARTNKNIDGTKRRWTADERSARRTVKGGRPAAPRDSERYPRDDRRDDQGGQRNQDGQRNQGGQRNQDDRGRDARSRELPASRWSSDRGSGQGWNSRSGGRSDWQNRRDAGGRPAAGDSRGSARDDRPGADRYRSDDRRPSSSRAGRPSAGGYRGSRDTRGYQGSQNRGYQGSDDRGGYQRRDDRGGYQGSQSRGYQRSDDRGGPQRYQGSDDRGGPQRYQGSDDRGGERGSQTRGYQGSRNSGYQGSDARGYRGSDDRDHRGSTSYRGHPDRDDRGQNRRDDDRGGWQDRGHGSRRDDGATGGYDSAPREGYQGRDDRAPRRDFRDDRGPRVNRPSPARGASTLRPGAADKRRYDTRGARPRQDRQEEPTETDTMEWTAPTVSVSDDDQQVTGFSELGIPQPLVAALASQGITSPFPIQTAAMPDAMAGRDLLGRGRTGSGKTLAFGLPMITRLAQTPGALGVRGLVLVPTRELAMQVADVLAPLASELQLSVALVAGGMAYGPQLRAFERGVDIVVATPGRLIDLMEQGAANLSTVEITVLDEADHMADLGFWPAVTTIVDATPADGQRMLFSATLDHAIDALVRRYLHDPVTHEVDPDRASISTMTHRFWVVAPHHKNEMTARVAGRKGRTIVFVRTQQGADRVARQLREAGILAGSLHGGLTQGARARILAAFKDGHVPVLVATDVAARGIHVDEVSMVLQVDPPMMGKDYLHRSGRTARAGEDGVVLSIVLPHQRKQVLRLAEHAGVNVRFEQVTPDDELVDEVAGVAAERPVVSEEDYAAIIAPPVAKSRRPRSGYRPHGGYQGRRRG